MNINTLVVGLLSVAILLHVSNVYFSYGGPPPSELPWVPIQVGKARSFVNQTSDASMATEALRRTAIIRNPNAIFGYKGSTNGSLEWNFLTGICICPDRGFRCPENPIILDAGDAGDEVCDILDGEGTDVLDFGNSHTNVCDV